jgi:hypothetical protein
VYAVNATSGINMWANTNSSFGSTSPVVSPDGGTVYTVSMAGSFYAMETSNGIVEWEFLARLGLVCTGPAINADGTIYVGWSVIIGGVPIFATEFVYALTKPQLPPPPPQPASPPFPSAFVAAGVVFGTGLFVSIWYHAVRQRRLDVTALERPPLFADDNDSYGSVQAS